MAGSKKTNPLVFVVIGVVVFIIIGFALMSAGSIFFAGRLNQALKKEGVQYGAGDNSFVYKDKSGNSAVVGGTAKLPEDFPKDFPIYPGAKVAVAIKVKNAFSVTFDLSGAKLTDILKWYEEQMPTAGWEADEGAQGAQLTHYEKDDMNALLVFIEQDKGIYLKATISKK